MEGYGEIVVATLHYFMLVFIGMGTCLWLSLLSLEVLVALARGGVALARGCSRPIPWSSSFSEVS